MSGLINRNVFYISLAIGFLLFVSPNIHGITLPLSAKSKGKITGYYEPLSNLRNTPFFGHAIAISVNDGEVVWAVGRGEDVYWANKNAIRLCNQINDHPNECKKFYDAESDQCLAIVESSKFFVTGRGGSLDEAIDSTMRECTETQESNQYCSVAAIACGSNSSITVSKRLILSAQKLLQALGYNPGPVDGVMGPLTRNALKRYLDENGLNPNSDFDVVTFIQLTSSVYKEFPLPEERYASVYKDYSKY